MSESLALVHDYLTQRGGAERVVASWAEAFPRAPIYTSLFDPSTTFSEFDPSRVNTSWLNTLAPLRHRHRLAFGVLAPTMSRWHIDADVVLASSSGWAHGVRTNGRLVVYCHAPARWLYQTERYLRARSFGSRAHLATKILNPALTRWDQRAAHRADLYVANSTYTAQLIEDIYGLQAVVLAPPVNSPPANLDVPVGCDVVVVARLLPYKNIDLVLDVAMLSPELTFRVVGDGPLRRQLEQRATANVTFVGPVTDEQLWREYAGARLHLAVSHEDFGITPLEAAGAGRATVARRSGGYLDTITEATGVLVDEDHVTADSVRDAVVEALRRSWDARTLYEHAARFSPQIHVAKLKELLFPPLTTE